MKKNNIFAIRYYKRFCIRWWTNETRPTTGTGIVPGRSWQRSYDGLCRVSGDTCAQQQCWVVYWCRGGVLVSPRIRQKTEENRSWGTLMTPDLAGEVEAKQLKRKCLQEEECNQEAHVRKPCWEISYEGTRKSQRGHVGKW